LPFSTHASDTPVYYYVLSGVRIITSDNEKALALILCSGAMIVMCNMIKKEKRRRWWRTELYRKRVGNELMQDLKFQHVSGYYKNFTRMSPTD
jgi:hypothetical protein